MAGRTQALTAAIGLIVSLFVVGCGDDGVKPQDQYQTRLFRDYQCVDGIYFDVSRHDSIFSLADMMPGDSITYLELFYSVTPASVPSQYVGEIRSCSLFVDPIIREHYPLETFSGKFLRYGVDPAAGSFVFHPTEFYVIMDRPVAQMDVGAYIRYMRNGLEHEVGYLPPDDTSYVILKTIATPNPQPNFVTWKYVWRNVYYLGGPIEDPEDFTVTIYKGDATDPNQRDVSDPDQQSGVTYLRLLGLDANPADGKLDFYNEQIVDRVRGRFRFPSRTPFADPVLDVKVESLYNSSSIDRRIHDSQYYILITKRIKPIPG